MVNPGRVDAVEGDGEVPVPGGGEADAGRLDEQELLPGVDEGADGDGLGRLERLLQLGGADGGVLGLAARRAHAERDDVAVVVHRFDDDWFSEVAGEPEAAADGGVRGTHPRASRQPEGGGTCPLGVAASPGGTVSPEDRVRSTVAASHWRSSPRLRLWASLP